MPFGLWLVLTFIGMGFATWGLFAAEVRGRWPFAIFFGALLVSIVLLIETGRFWPLYITGVSVLGLIVTTALIQALEG